MGRHLLRQSLTFNALPVSFLLFVMEWATRRVHLAGCSATLGEPNQIVNRAREYWPS